MKKGILFALAVLLITQGLTGCSQKTEQETKKSEDSKSSAQSQEPKELEQVDVVLDWYPNAVHAFLYVAEEKGYYEQEGIKINILFPSNANDAISLPAAGKADIGLYYQNDSIITRANQKVPIKAIGTIVQGSITVVAALKDKNINSPEDFSGRIIGYTGDQFSETAIQVAVENMGGSMDNVTLVNVGFDLMSAMTTGNVDATYGCFVNHEIPALEAEGFEMDYFSLSDFSIPEEYSLVFVAGEKNLENKKDLYIRFLKASKKGYEDMKKNSDEALEILLKNQNEENFPLSTEVEKKSIEVLLPMMEKENSPFLTQDKIVWEKNIDWLFENGMIQEKISPDDMVEDLLP